jgi:hypothetical protein
MHVAPGGIPADLFPPFGVRILPPRASQSVRLTVTAAGGDTTPTGATAVLLLLTP